MSNRAIIDFYDINGTILNNFWDIFSGATIDRNTTSPTQRFRVYNNYSGTSDITNANNIKLYISGDDQFLTDQVEKKEIFDYTREVITSGYLQIRCTLASETGLVPPSGSSFVPLYYGIPFYGTGFDTIMSSGSYNYNEYEMKINVPASGTNGSWLQSGSIYFSFFMTWDNEGFATG